MIRKLQEKLHVNKCIIDYPLIFFRCFSKTGVRSIEMTPLHASLLVKACIVLHNRCIDWGLRKPNRGQNRDPEHEINIQVRAHMRFTMYNQEIAEENLPDGPERYGTTNESIELWRAHTTTRCPRTAVWTSTWTGQ